MLQAIWPDQQADIRELIVQTESTTAAHAVVVGRPGPGPIQDRYEIDEVLTTPAPTSIAIVDDVLTTGAHFRAARAVLAARFSTAAASIFGGKRSVSSITDLIAGMSDRWAGRIERREAA